MLKNKRYLITTEDEATWKFDQPVIFLGEWCCLYDRKHIWQNMDAIVAKPYGVDLFTKEKDDIKVKKLEQKILQELSVILNENFYTNHNTRFWQIILGPWLRTILSLLLNRINTLKQCLDLEEISETSVYLSNYGSLAVPNLRSGFTFFFAEEKWNNILNGRILSLLDKNRIFINYIKYNDDKYLYQNFTTKKNNNNQSLYKYPKEYFYRLYKKVISKFVGKKDAFIINTYLKLKQQIKLEFNLGQYPQLWKRDELNINAKPNQILRKKLTDKLLKKPFDETENIIRNLLFELLPTCYLEGFEELLKIVDKQPWRLLFLEK